MPEYVRHYRVCNGCGRDIGPYRSLEELDVVSGARGWVRRGALHFCARCQCKRPRSRRELVFPLPVLETPTEDVSR